MPLRKVLRWTLPPLALIALAGWFTSSAAPRQDASADAAAASRQAAGMVPAQGPAAQPPSAAGPVRLAGVQKFVAQKNAESGSDRENFVHEGWQLVQAPPPDAKLIAL